MIKRKTSVSRIFLVLLLICLYLMEYLVIALIFPASLLLLFLLYHYIQLSMNLCLSVKTRFFEFIPSCQYSLPEKKIMSTFFVKKFRFFTFSLTAFDNVYFNVHILHCFFISSTLFEMFFIFFLFFFHEADCLYRQFLDFSYIFFLVSNSKRMIPELIQIVNQVVSLYL